MDRPLRLKVLPASLSSALSTQRASRKRPMSSQACATANFFSAEGFKTTAGRVKFGVGSWTVSEGQCSSIKHTQYIQYAAPSAETGQRQVYTHPDKAQLLLCDMKTPPTAIAIIRKRHNRQPLQGAGILFSAGLGGGLRKGHMHPRAGTPETMAHTRRSEEDSNAQAVADHSAPTRLLSISVLARPLDYCLAEMII
jgi:hypothetical protein